MKPVMYLFANTGLGMSPGKLGAQVAHAAVEAAMITPVDMIEAWYKGGHYAKLVCEAMNGDELLTIQAYIEERGFPTKLIIDEGRTEIPPFSKTALGCAVVDKDDEHTALTFEAFKLLKPPHWTELAEEIKSRQPSRWKRLKTAW